MRWSYKKLSIFALILCIANSAVAAPSLVSPARLRIGARAEQIVGGKLYCAVGASGFRLGLGRQLKPVATRRVLKKLQKAIDAAPSGGRNSMLRARALVEDCRDRALDTPTPSPTATPTPIERCAGDQFLWQVGAAGDMPPLSTAAAPHIRRDRAGLVNMGWFGALPQIVDDTQDERNRLQWLGIPFIAESGKLIVNGGTPILGDLDLHAAHVARDILALVPNPNFDGFLIFDFEMWWAQWELNDQYFQQRAVADMMLLRPELNADEALAEARQLWEEKGLEFYRATQRIVKQARPHAKVGWYDVMMRHYWSGYASSNGDRFRAINDKILDLHREADYVVASIYQFYSSAVNEAGDPLEMPAGGGAPPNGIAWFERNRQYVYENIREAQRLGELAGGKPVMAYAWSRYHDSAAVSDRFHTVRRPDLFLQIIYPHLLGANYVTIWGAESAVLQRPTLGAMQPYIDNAMAPMVEEYCTGDLLGLAPMTRLIPSN